MIRNLPPLYDSKPNDPSARRIGSYLMWTAIAATCVTSSMFLTALAPNLLAVEMIRKTTNVELGWMEWFLAFAPTESCCSLRYRCSATSCIRRRSSKAARCRPGPRRNCRKMGPLSRREIMLAVLVLIALALWIFGDDFVNATTAALVVIWLMLLTRVVSWDDMLGQQAGLEHAGLVRDPGRACRRPEPHRLRQVVCRHHGGAHERRSRRRSRRSCWC